MKKPKGKFVTGKYRVFRPTARELKLARDFQEPKKEPATTDGLPWKCACGRVVYSAEVREEHRAGRH